MTKTTTTVQLSRAVDLDGRTVDQLVIVGAPGAEALPVHETADGFRIDTLEMMSIVIRRTKLSKPTLEKLAPFDLLALTLTLFLPPRRRPDGKQKPKR